MRAEHDIVFGDQIKKYEYIFLQAFAASSPNAVRNYKERLTRQLGALQFTPQQAGASDMSIAERPRASLGDIYVDLKTFAPDRKALEHDRQIRRQGDTEPVLLQHALRDQRVAVVLGKPGSGKSTFFKRLLLSFIEGTPLPEWPEQDLDYAPVFLELRQLARWYENSKDKPEPNAGAVWDYILYRLRVDAGERAYDWLREQAEQGSLFMVMDGLDEVPADLTTFIKQVIQDFIEKNHRNRVLITCRFLSWAEPEWRLELDLPLYMIRGWDDGQIADFAQRWYTAAAHYWGLEVAKQREMIKEFLEALARPRLVEIKRIPLLLTIMAMIHTEKEALPHRISDLYAMAVDRLIARWDTVKPDEEGHRLGQLLREGEVNEDELKSALAQIAWEFHMADQPVDGVPHEGELPEISGEHLCKAMRNLRPQEKFAYDWARKLLEGMRLRAGLLLPVGGREDSFQFPHRSFQEYMAGLHLAGLSEHDNGTIEAAGGFSGIGWELGGQGGSYWRYVLRFAVGSLGYTEADHRIKVSILLKKLLGKDEPATEQDWRRIWLAGELLLERGRSQVERHARGLPERIHAGLKRLLAEGALNWRERAEVADLLDHEDLGDDRPGVRMPDWVAIESGPFIMGSKPDDEEAYKSEYQQPRELHMPHDYCIARFPVTVAQYAQFIEDGGYEHLDWWDTEAVQQWLGKFRSKSPREWDAQQLFPNRPVFYITWYEARAWCAWATDRLSDWQQDSPSDALAALMAKGECVVRLPTEAEWECAARGAQGRRYPWGDEDWTPEHAMLSDENNPHLGHPVAVGLFPRGVTPGTGIHDLSGNVWEWTLSRWQNYLYAPSESTRRQRNDPEGNDARVVRGGGFFNYPRDGRCAYRGINVADFVWMKVRGFRVVVSLANSEY